MRGKKSSGRGPGTRRAWQPPALTKLAIGTETKSGQTNARGAAQPEPPPAPDSKFGFSFEMALPLSTRTDV